MENCFICKNKLANYNGNVNACCDCEGIRNKALLWFRKKYTSKCIVTNMIFTTDRDNNVVPCGEYDNISVRIHIEYDILVRNEKARPGVVCYTETIPNVVHKRNMAFTNYPD